MVWLCGMTEKSQRYGQKYLSREGPFQHPLPLGNYRLTFLEGPDRSMEKSSTKGERVAAWYAVNDLQVDQYCRYSYADLEASQEKVVARL